MAKEIYITCVLLHITFLVDICPKLNPMAMPNEMKHSTQHVIVRMKSQSQQFGPKETVSRVSQEAGSIVGAAAPGKLPRNEHQVSNCIIVKHNPVQIKGCDSSFH